MWLCVVGALAGAEMASEVESAAPAVGKAQGEMLSRNLAISSPLTYLRLPQASNRSPLRRAALSAASDQRIRRLTSSSE